MPTKSTKSKIISSNQPEPEKILFAKNDTRGAVAFTLSALLGVFGYIQLWSLLGVVMVLGSIVLLLVAIFSLLPTDLQIKITGHSFEE